ncbi:hypothetical protein [Pseudoalteromonas gelatinilytica]
MSCSVVSFLLFGLLNCEESNIFSSVQVARNHHISVDKVSSYFQELNAGLKQVPNIQFLEEDKKRQLVADILISTQNRNAVSIGTSLATVKSSQCTRYSNPDYELHYKVTVSFINMGLFTIKQAHEYGVIDPTSYKLLEAIESGECENKYSELAKLNEVISVLGEHFTLMNTTMSDNSITSREDERIGTGKWRELMEGLTKAKKNKLIRVKANTEKKYDFEWFEYFEKEYSFDIQVTEKYSEVMQKVEPTIKAVENYWGSI